MNKESLKPMRSLLFVPGDSTRKIQRAMECRAGVVIIDLEDSIAPRGKETARERAGEFLAKQRSKPVAVRVNGQDTSWYLDDLLTVAAVAPDYVMLPKCRGIHDLARLDCELSLLERAHGLSEGRIQVLPLVTEDAISVESLEYRGAPKRTAALCFAAEDLASDLAISARDSQGRLAPPLAHARLKTLFAARSANLPAIDTPFPDPRRIDLLRYESEMAMDSGFVGKLCIHPDQIAIVEEALAPSQEKIRWAEAVITAFAKRPESGVALVDGRMVDKAHLRMATELLDRSKT